MRFCPTKAFFLCLIALPILLGLNSYVARKASPQCYCSQSQTAVEMALSTKASTKEQLRTALNWDFLFIPIYSLVIGLLCFIFARIANLPMQLTWLVILLLLVGALVDASENFALLHVIATSQNDVWANVARRLATLKYVLPSIGVLYAIVSAIVGFINVDKR